MAFFNTEDYTASIKDIQTALKILDDHRIANSTLAMLQAGLGSIQSLLGNYTDSVEHLIASAKTATRIGNERVQHLVSANLSVAYNRLGEYKKSIEWAELAMSYPHEIYTAAQQGAIASYAMLRKQQVVQNMVDHWTPIIQLRCPAGVRQAWSLFCADAYLILGETQKAETTARHALKSGKLLLDYYAGTYARWIARIGRSDNKLLDASQKLSQLNEHIINYHKIDRLEILVAIAWLDHKRNGYVEEEHRSLIIDNLNQLPHGIKSQLNYMGMLEGI
jgi:tetratricopeptide (TPR) repeat protein